MEEGWQHVRDRRLRADFRKLQELIRHSDLIHIESVEGDPPETYIIRFSCIGIAKPGVLRPVYTEQHRVWIQLPANYPTRQPRLRWLTPIFHPNINQTGTQVCIDVWYPSKFLDDLCIMLGRMIQYKNYNPYNPLRIDAAQWAVQHTHLFPVDDRPLRRGLAENDEPDEFEIKIL